MSIDLYITFKREDPQDVKKGDSAQFAQLSFGGATPTAQQLRVLENRFVALSSCKSFRYHPKTSKAFISAVGLGQPDEKKFVEQVTACARQHFNVKRVVRAK